MSLKRIGWYLKSNGKAAHLVEFGGGGYGNEDYDYYSTFCGIRIHNSPTESGWKCLRNYPDTPKCGKCLKAYERRLKEAKRDAEYSRKKANEEARKLREKAKEVGKCKVKIFLISPVRGVEPETQKRISAYVKDLERNGHAVHWPIRDTKQDDPSGGYEICRTNFSEILKADEIHIWYDETSNGSKFDMGGVFMLVEMLGKRKRVVVVNDEEVVDNTKKSFYKVFKHLVEKTK